MAAKKQAETNSQSNILLPGCKPEELTLNIAGNIVKHLGVQMYAGRPVPAIAELISNAWDADATKVDVNIPLGVPWDQEDQEQIIEVIDNGIGMNWEMVRDAYLNVGRDRRIENNTDKSPGGRTLQGRKGVGKLAGFGIANLMEVQTVYHEANPAVGEKVLIWLRLDLAELEKARKTPTPVKVVFAGPVSKAPDGSRRTKGTTVTLRQLHPRRAQNADRFHHSMAQRFLLIGPGFLVLINGEELRSEGIALQWRWPDEGWSEEEIPGFGPVSYWIGFTPQPRKQNEGELSGILIYTRGKISQEATFFNISGGVTGQHGLRYLVGMVKAEWLDAAGVDSPDYVATHRGSIAWESPAGEALQDWGQRLLRKSLTEWARLRSEMREKAIKELSPEFRLRIERLTPAYKDVALRFIDKFKNVEMEATEFEDILTWFLDALENATLRSILMKLRKAKTTDLAELDNLFTKMEVRTAVSLLQIIDSNLTAIDTLETMHLQDARERDVIAKHLERNPWLIEPTWMLSKAEAEVAAWVKDRFGLDKTGEKEDKRRADFFCISVAGTIHIVEIKRGRHTATLKDINQADGYRRYVLSRFQELKDPNALRFDRVQSHLIADGLHKDAESIADSFARDGKVIFTSWDDLIRRAKFMHHQYREVYAEKAASEEDTPLAEAEETRTERKPKAAKPTAKKAKKPASKRPGKKRKASKSPSKKTIKPIRKS